MSYFVDVFVLHYIVSLHYKDTTSGHALSSISGYFFSLNFIRKDRFSKHKDECINMRSRFHFPATLPQAMANGRWQFF